MASSGAARSDDLAEIEIIFLRIVRHPVQRAETVLDGSGRERNVRQTVLDVDDGEAHLHVRQTFEEAIFLAAVDPAATVNDQDDGRRCFGFLWTIDVELELVIVGDAINDVRGDFEIVGDDHRGPLLGRELGSGDARECEQEDRKQ